MYIAERIGVKGKVILMIIKCDFIQEMEVSNFHIFNVHIENANPFHLMISQ